VETPVIRMAMVREKFFYICLYSASIILILVGLIFYLSKGFPDRLHMPEVTRESLLRSSKCIGSQKDNYIINSSICIIGDIGNTRSDAAIFGDSHSIAILPVFDKIGKVYSKNYVHIGVGGCPPLLGVYVKGNNNIDFCN